MTSFAPTTSSALHIANTCDSVESLYITWKVADSHLAACRRLCNRSWRLMNLHILRLFPPDRLNQSHLMLNGIESDQLAGRSTDLVSSRQTPFYSRFNINLDEAFNPALCYSVNEFSQKKSLYHSFAKDELRRSKTLKTERLSNASNSIRMLGKLAVHNSARDGKQTTCIRPSLFLKNSNQAILSVGMDSSCYDSGEDTSDISEDEAFDSDTGPEASEYLEYDLESTLALISPRKATSSPGILQAQKKNHLTSDMGKSNNRTPVKMQTNHILAETPDNGKNIFYILNSPSPSKTTAQEVPDKCRGLLFCSDNDELVSRAHLANSVSSLEVSEGDDDENDEADEADEADDVEGLVDQMSRSTLLAISHNFAGSKLSKSSKSVRSAGTDSEWVSVSSDGEVVESPPIPPPLSFSKRIPAPSSPNTSKNGTCDKLQQEEVSGSFTPRSLLLGLFLNELAQGVRRNDFGRDTSKRSGYLESHISSASQSHQDLTALQQKPILKRSSTTGIITVDRNATKRTMQRPSIFLLKRFASLSDISRNVVNHRSPVLYVAEEECIKESETSAVDENQFAKQVSSVGLSDFMVVANCTSASSVLQSRIESDSDFDQFKIVNEQPNVSESRLSTGLSKYSNLQSASGASFKSFLSKSSLNLSSLFGQGKTIKPRLEQRSVSSETVKSSPSTTKSCAKTEESSKSPGSDSSPHPKEPELSRSIKVSPFPKKHFQPSMDMSNSLKDSLLIDHKLGKIPMPDRVVDEINIINGKELVVFSNDSNDYHAKGW